jgi:hypothetical protein
LARFFDDILRMVLMACPAYFPQEIVAKMSSQFTHVRAVQS